VPFVLLLAACASAPPPAQSPCREQLARYDVEFEAVPDFSSGGCSVKNAVKVSRFGRAKLSTPAMMTCPLALKLSEWEATMVQPAAKRILGSPIVTIHHYGTYSCRRATGGSRMSEHAKANAIDIGIFETEKREKISVTLHWKGNDKKAEFLKTVGQGACTLFGGVLGPDSDRNHYDHFHFDMGPYDFCRLNPVDPRVK
jgi:hypothetical protein